MNIVFSKLSHPLLVGLFVLGVGIAGCSTPHEVQTKALTNFVDRETVEDWPDDKIVANNLDVTSLKKRKKATVGVYVSVCDQSQGRERALLPQAFLGDAQGLAENYLSRIKSYHVKTLDSDKLKRDDLMAGDDVELKEFAYLIDMKIDLNTESDTGAASNKARLYRVSIDWKLIDNRTKKNGMGKNETPYILEALTCQNAIGRKVSSEDTNSQSIFRKALENALVEFRAQLANRLTFGGRIVGQRQRDGKVRFLLDAGMGVGDGDKKGGDGIEKRMQMLVINEDGDNVCVAQVMNGIGGKTTLEVWRWLSKSLKEEILQKVKKAKRPSKSNDDEDEEADEDDEECFYAVSLGMPTPPKDERTNVSDSNK